MTRMKNLTYVCALIAAGILCAPRGASAQHAHSDIEIGSSTAGGGELVAEYDFDINLRTDFATEVGPIAVYSSTTPGFVAAEDEAPELYELDNGTTVDMMIVTIDEAISIQVDATTLAAPGDVATIGTHDGVPGDDGALHNHPTYQLLLDAPKGEFREGDVSFVLQDPASAYGDSTVHTLHVTNGYPPPVEEPTNDTAKCQKQVGGEVRKLINTSYGALAKCLDQIQSWKASGADIETDPVPNSVAKACSDPVAGAGARIASARAKAQDKVVDKCVGVFGETEEATIDAVSPHLGMATCRVEDLIGAAYSSALEDIAVVVFGDDEEAASEAFPCIGESQGDTVPEEE